MRYTHLNTAWWTQARVCNQSNSTLSIISDVTLIKRGRACVWQSNSIHKKPASCSFHNGSSYRLENTQNTVQQCKYMVTLWMEEPVVQSIQITALSVASGALLIEDDTNKINDELICHIHHRVMSACECVCVYQSVSSKQFRLIGLNKTPLWDHEYSIHLTNKYSHFCVISQWMQPF